MNDENVYLAVLSQKSTMTLIDSDFNKIDNIDIGTYINDMDSEGDYIYAVDSGFESSNSDLVKFNLKTKEKEILTLPKSPDLLAVQNNIAYISSTSEEIGKGFYFFIVDLDELKIIDTIFTQGMVTFNDVINHKVIVGVNTGGANNYGKEPHLLEISINGKNAVTNKIKILNQELAPSAITFYNNVFFGVYPGFSYGPRPNWVENHEEYTNKVKKINPSTGEIMDEFALEINFPQKVVENSGLLYINHFTYLDLKGNYISVFDPIENKVQKSIEVNSPSDIVADNSYLYVGSYEEGSVNIYSLKSLTNYKNISIGEGIRQITIID